MIRLFLLIAAISGALAVILGAFAAHGLKSLPVQYLNAFETGVRYQMYHSLVLLLLGLLMTPASLAVDQNITLSVYAKISGFAFIAGIVLFSGSLYGLSLSQGKLNFLGPITPLGGLSLIIGWLFLAVTVWTRQLSSH